MPTLQGQFLVASPYLGDGNFNRSVVLVIKHDEDGAFGLVLNRPTDSTVSDIWKVVAETPSDCLDPIYLGGPVSGPLVALHSLSSASEAEVVEGVFFSAHKDHLDRVVRAQPPFRLFSGYSGWDKGQLDGEMEAGGWLTCPATAEFVFYKPDDLWEQLVRIIAREILAPAIKTNQLPSDPSLN